MIVDGIKTPKIRIPKRYFGKYTKYWDGALPLLLRLATAAIRRWSIMPHGRGGEAQYDYERYFYPERDLAVRAWELIDQLPHKDVWELFTIDELCGWAQTEVNFQRESERR